MIGVYFLLLHSIVVLLKMKFRNFFYVLTVFTAALLILVLRWRHILQPREQKTTIVSRGYVLSYRFWDQTSGVVNVMSLQCWAETMNMSVPEHFLIGERLDFHSHWWKMAL